MSMVTKRYLELVFRKETLENIVSKTEEQLNNKAMIMLSKSMDSDVEDKLTGSLAMMKKWLSEIKSDAEALEEKLVDELDEDWITKAYEQLSKQNKGE